MGTKMVLENKLDITNSAQLADAEEKLTKKQAALLFQTGDLFKMEVEHLQDYQRFTIIYFQVSMISLEKSVMSILQRITFNLPPVFF